MTWKDGLNSPGVHQSTDLKGICAGRGGSRRQRLACRWTRITAFHGHGWGWRATCPLPFFSFPSTSIIPRHGCPQAGLFTRPWMVGPTFHFSSPSTPFSLGLQLPVVCAAVGGVFGFLLECTRLLSPRTVASAHPPLSPADSSAFRAGCKPCSSGGLLDSESRTFGVCPLCTWSSYVYDF